MLVALGRPVAPIGSIRMWVGNGAETLVRRGLSGSVEINKHLDEKLVDEALDIFLASYKAHLSEATVAYPQVLETLQTLKERGFKLAIVTNKPSAFVPDILKSLNIETLFDLVLGGDSLAVKKPDPEPLLYVCKQLKIEREDAVMVGDSKNDIEAAHAAKMQSVGVTYGYNYGVGIETFKPTVVIETFDVLLKYLERIKP